MNIYTSYFGNAKALAKHGIKLVSIALWQPRYLSVPVVLRDVAPTPWMVKQASRQQYIDAYQQILSRIDPYEFLQRLDALSGGSDIALCCYEKPGEFCHRHLLAEYLTKATGVVVEEFVAPAPPPEPLKVEKIEPPSLFDDL